jgi:hypothetical protein
MATRHRTRRPGDYLAHCRADGRPILGATPAERLEQLFRLRSAIAAAGWDEGEANFYSSRSFGQVGIELLTAGEAEALIARLAGAREAA